MCDRSSAKIPNVLILMGYATGFIYNIYEKGVYSIPETILSMVWPILLLYVLFRIRAIGAGDIKLFSSISAFLDYHQMLTVIYMSFLIGATVGLIRILKSGQIRALLKNFHFNLQTVITEKRLKNYQIINRNIEILHFAGCIFAAVWVLFLREVLF